MIVTPIVLREAILSGLKTTFEKVDVAVHGGVFTLETLRRYGANAPAMRLVLTAIGKPYRYSTGQWVVPCEWAIVVIAKDRIGQSRDVIATGLVTSLALVIGGQRWGLDNVALPDNIDGRNETDENHDKEGLTVWQLVFEQALLMGGETEDVEQTAARLTKLLINGDDFIDGAAPLPGDPARVAP